MLNFLSLKRKLSKMSADHKHEISESDDVIIPITEWPVSTTCDSRQATKRKLEQKNQQNRVNKVKLGFSTSRDGRETAWPQSQLSGTHSHPTGQSEIADGDKEPSITLKIAKWWRQTRARGCSHIIPKCGPKSMLYHISRLPECRSYLQRERKRLLTLIEMQSCNKADVIAALASLDDFTGNFYSANHYIQQAVQLEPSCVEYLWLKTKISKQCQILEEQAAAKKDLIGKEVKFPSAIEVPKVSGKELSIVEFQNYVASGKPVIITDIVDEMTEVPFDYSLVMKHAGNIVVTTKEAASGSLTWAKLENKREITVADLIQGVQSDSADDFVFDWSLPLHCPSLAAQISLPPYFKNNFLLQTAPGSLYKDSWPSLFIAPQGATTQLHVDAFHSHFWMALFQGEKRWTFFDQKDLPFLYPQLFQSMDPVFEVDLNKPDLEKFPLLALVRPQQCVLQPGELLFVPAGSPHYVENLTQTLAISSNYVDESNIEKVCKELKTNALQDQRAHDLLLQLQDPAFLSRVTKTKE